MQHLKGNLIKNEKITLISSRDEIQGVALFESSVPPRATPGSAAVRRWRKDYD